MKPERDVDFVLAAGTTLARGASECVFELEGRRATSPVVLGQTEDEALLAAVTLDTLGVMLNALNPRASGDAEGARGCQALRRSGFRSSRS